MNAAEVALYRQRRPEPDVAAELTTFVIGNAAAVVLFPVSLAVWAGLAAIHLARRIGPERTWPSR